MKDEVYCVLFSVHQFPWGSGIFFSSAAIIRRLRKYTATLPLFKKGHSIVNIFSSVFHALLSTNVERRKYNCHDAANHMNRINS